MNLNEVILPVIVAGALLAFVSSQAQLPLEGDESPAPQDDVIPGGPAPLDTVTEESMISYAQGLAALKMGRIDEAVERLQDAVQLKPEEAQYRYMLAMAYEKAEKWPNRWFQLRQTVLLKPDHGDAIRELLDMWQVALNKGVLDIGTATEQVKIALGEPDRVQSEGDSSTWQYGFMGVQFQQEKLVSTFDLRALENFMPPLEVIEFSFDARHWKLTQQRIELQRTLLQYIPDTAASDNPQGNEEVFTVERLFNLRKEMSVHELMETMKANLQKKYPDIEWNVIEKGDDDILFEWRLQNDDGAGQHEMIRLLSGQNDIHRIAYTAHRIDDREAWQNILQQSKLSEE